MSQEYPENSEDPWEREYAYYLERRMEEQYWEELEAQYEAQLSAEYEGSLDDEEVVVTGLNNSEMSFTVMNPADYNTMDDDSIEHQILHLPLENEDAATVGQYLGLLLSTLWIQGDGFSGKRPFGNSDWQYVIYGALGKAGIIEMTFDEDGFIDDFTSDEQYKADELILRAIKYTYNH